MADENTEANNAETQAAEASAADLKISDNTIFVGNKGTMAYVLAVVTQLNQGATDIVIKARGRAISRAVDVAEIVKNKFATEAKIKEIKTSTEEVESNEGKKVKVSAIEIKVAK